MIQDRQAKKQELIKNGDFERYIALKKEQYDAGFEPNDDPAYYLLDEEAKDLLDCLEKSTKRKKADFRRHSVFMSKYYDNIGLLTLTFSTKALDKSNLERKKQVLTEILKKCFEDYIGKFEISPNGRLHAHLIVGWNGSVDLFPAKKEKNGEVRTIALIRKHDLQELWYGEKDENGQPTKYGIYELQPINRSRDDLNASTNYAMKSLNTIESYITKDEQVDLSDLVDESLIIAVNTSNIITARGTPYQAFKKARNEQDKMIRKKARTFNGSFYDKHKFDGRKIFREWAMREKEQNISVHPGEHIDLFGKDFRLVDIEDYKEG